ncbi:MAG: heavy-metal-associated domain-containing protein [Deltaproteobacteria bacterium]|nr:heavy-metal-associated domain-containing protein [Deltaproteobacteria bacterium]
MVCAFCAQGIEKHFRAEQAVADVMVDLHRKLVAVTLKPEAKFDDAAAVRIIEDAGYKTASLEHTNRALDVIRAEGKK